MMCTGHRPPRIGKRKSGAYYNAVNFYIEEVHFDWRGIHSEANVSVDKFQMTQTRQFFLTMDPILKISSMKRNQRNNRT